MKLIALRVALISVLGACSANSNDAHLLGAVKNAFKQNFPGRSVVSVSKTPLKGVYEVVVQGNKIVYVDQEAKYLILGNILDVKNNSNLTSQKEKELSRIEWNTLPLELAIKDVRGNGSRKLAVFTDPDCSYCKRLERESLEGITDVTIYSFLYPLTQIHPDALHKSRQIWCAQDRLATWVAYMRKDQPLSGPGDCLTPLDKIQALGERLAVTGTPALVFGNGQIEAGALPRSELEILLTKWK